MCQTSSLLERGVHCRVRPRVRVVGGTGMGSVRRRWPWDWWGVSGYVIGRRGGDFGGGEGGGKLPWRSR